MRKILIYADYLPANGLLVLFAVQIVRTSVLARIWIFFPKKELFKFFRELFAKERNYPSTTKLHDEARKQVRSSYITCTEYTKQNIVPS